MGRGRSCILPQEGAPFLNHTKAPCGPLATMLQPTQKLPEQQWLSLEATTSLPLSTRPSFPMTPEAGCPKSRSTAIHWVAQALTNKKSKPF